MRAYDQNRKNQLKQHSVIPKALMKMPVKNVAVKIRPGLTVYTDSKSKIEAVKLKYANK